MSATENQRRGRGRPKLTLEAARGAAAARGGACTSEEYEGAKARLGWRCASGHEWAASLSSVRSMGTWCPQCRPPRSAGGRKPLTLEAAREAAAARGGACTSGECEGSTAILGWRCASGHTWAATLNSVRNMGTWCPSCARGGSPLTLEDARETAKEKGGDCISDEAECEGSHSRLVWQCAEGHTWAARFKAVRYMGTWCPHCRASTAEKKSRAYLVERLGEPSPERRPQFLLTPTTPVGLELDMYYPEHGFAVEVQGNQHRMWVPHFQPTREEYERQLARDAEKRALCYENWVVLIEIWPEDDAEELLETHLRDLGIMPREPDPAPSIETRAPDLAPLIETFAAPLIETRAPDPAPLRTQIAGKSLLWKKNTNDQPLGPIAFNFAIFDVGGILYNS